MDNWNPLKESYEDPQFNRYSFGVGKDLSEQSKHIKLYVENIPPILVKEGLYNLFAEYGKVIDVALNKPKTNHKGLVGFVTMDNMVDAEAAISKIHERKIGQNVLRVKPALTEEEKDRRRQQHSDEIGDDTSSVRSYASSKHSFAKNRGQSERTSSKFDAPSFGRGNARPVDEPRARNNFNDSAGESFGRGRGFVQNSNKEYIEMNSKNANFNGNTQKKLPFTQPEQSNDWDTDSRSDVGEKVSSPISGYKKPRVLEKVCGYCLNPGCVNHCSVCMQYYCSVACQKKDWPRHKDLCKEIFSRHSEMIRETFSQDENEETDDQPGRGVKPDTKFGFCGKMKDEQFQDEKRPAESKKMQQKNTQKDAVLNAPQSDLQRPKKFNQGKSQNTNGDRNGNQSAGDSGGTTKELNTFKATLSVGANVKVIVTYFKSPNEFWVSPVEHLMEFSELSDDLNKKLEKSTSNPLFKPGPRAICASQFDGVWSRVRVEALNNKQATVLYVDFGNTETVNVERLRQLTPDMLVLPPQAIACCLSKLEPKGSVSWDTKACAAVEQWFGPLMSKFFNCLVKDIKDNLHEVSISFDGEDLREKLLRDGLAQEAQPKRIMVSALKSRKQLLKVGDKLKVVITETESASKFNVIEIEAYKLLSQINILMNVEYTRKSQPYRPVKGELVVARFPGDNSWFRCEVVNVKEEDYQVYCVDFGTQGVLKEENIHYVKNSNLAEFPTLALKCTLFGQDTFADIAEDSIRKEYDTLLKEFWDCKNVLSMVIKDVDKLLVDFLSKSGDSFSQRLNKILEDKYKKDSSRQQKSSPTATSVPCWLSKPYKTSKKTCENSELETSKLTTTKLKSSKLGTEELKLGDISKVNVCFVVSAGEFYVRLISRDADFMAMMQELNVSIQGAPVMSAPCVGALVAIQYSLDGLWYRGKVQSIKGHECEVLFLDYANTQRTNVGGLRELSSALLELPVQAIQCRLNCKSQLSKHAVELFKTSLENEIISLKAVKCSQEGYLVNIAIPANIHLDFLKDMDINQPSVELEIPNLDFAVNSVVKVVCVDMDDPMRFYLQVKENIISLKKLTHKLNKRLCHLLVPLQSVHVGCFAAAKSKFDEEDEKYCRVSVKSISGDKCVVFFVDYGVTEETLKSNLMKLSEEDFLLPACAIACSLNGCQLQKSNRLFSSSDLNFIDSVKIVGRKEHFFIVDVLDCDGDCITNTFLSENSPCSPKSSASNVAVKKVLKSLDHQKLPSTDQPIPVVINHLDSSQDVYVILRDDYVISNFLHLMKKLNDEIESCKPLKDPKSGQLCAAKFSQDNSWYRARLVEIVNSKMGVVQFVDYGNTERTLLSELRTMEAEFMTQPAQAIHCCLSGYESHGTVPGDAEMLPKLKSELIEKPLFIKVVKKLGDKFVIQVENEQGESIIQKLPNAVHKRCMPRLSDLLLETPPKKEFSAIFHHIQSFDEFYCQRIDPQEMSELQSLNDSLIEDSVKLEKHNSCEPVVGCVYMSEFQGAWYRCFVQEVKGSKVLIKYIDYGNTEVRSSKELYPLSSERMLLPVRLIKCKLFGVQPLNGDWNSPEIKTYFKILATKQPILVLHEEMDETFLVSIFIVEGGHKKNVADDLIHSGLATRAHQRPTSNLPLASSVSDDEEEEDSDEQELKKQIIELQKKLALTKKSKKKASL